MVTISAKMVKELRDKTGAGMMECKKALVKVDGDVEEAIGELRKTGAAKAASKVGRTAKEGRVLVKIDGNVGVAIEVLCETDFVAKTEAFQGFCDALLGRVFSDYDDDGIISEKVAEAEQSTLTGLIGTIGENMQVRRTARWTGDNTLASYIHMNGNIGVMIEVEGESDEELLHNICLHIAAFNPRYITPEEVSESVLEKEREIAAAQAEGKPENIIGKIVIGKINKWYSEVCLARQPWIRDDKTTLAKFAPKTTVKRFVRWQVGEEL